MNKIAVTFGDPNGVGPEICAKALGKIGADDLKRIVLVGEKQSAGQLFRDLFAGLKGPELILLEPEGSGYRHQPGEKSPASGKMSFRFICKALELAMAGSVKGIVTGPVSKEMIRKSGQADFTDHTTWLAKKFGVRNYSMMFHAEKFNVLLATIHVPLKKVPAVLNRETVRIALDNAAGFCEKFYKENGYRIAVCGLNPHAGENGMLGKEEWKTISPVTEEFRKKGIPVDGPLPADTVFFRAARGEYRMVVAMYHDQGLAPFKMLCMNEGVNVTLGLPVVRTSPDHGTAFDIAGKNIADPGSMEQALRLALDLTRES